MERSSRTQQSALPLQGFDAIASGCTWLLHSSPSCSAPVLARCGINEIFYHPPQDLEDLQWIELFNTANRSLT